MRIKHFATALAITACVGMVPTIDVNAAPAAPTKDALVRLEKSAYQAWKSRDTAFWDTFLSDKFVGYGSSGRLDKASEIEEHRKPDCEIKSYDLSNEQVKPLGNNAALITYKATVDGTCDGHQVPPNSWAATVYRLEGDQWRAVFHSESPIVDPTAKPAKPIGNPEVPKTGKPKPAARGCYGQAPPPVWGTSIYVKEGDTWKWTFGINTPARD